MLPSKLDGRYTLTLPNNTHLPVRILAALRMLRSVKTGFCISAHPEIDGSAISLDDFEDRDGTIVSFIPGKFAYDQSEHGIPTFQCVLVRNAALKRRAAAELEDLSAQYRRANTKD